MASRRDATEYRDGQQTLRAFDVSEPKPIYPLPSAAITFPPELGILRQLVVDHDGRTVFAFTDAQLVVRRLPSARDQ